MEDTNLNEPIEEIATWKTIIKWGVILLVGLLVIWNLYFFGFKKLMDNSYQKGVLAGKNEINNTIITNLLQFGKLQINIPVNEQGQADPNGTQTRAVILTPEIQNNATTTK